MPAPAPAAVAAATAAGAAATRPRWRRAAQASSASQAAAEALSPQAAGCYAAALKASNSCRPSLRWSRGPSWPAAAARSCARCFCCSYFGRGVLMACRCAKAILLCVRSTRPHNWVRLARGRGSTLGRGFHAGRGSTSTGGTSRCLGSRKGGGHTNLYSLAERQEASAAAARACTARRFVRRATCQAAAQVPPGRSWTVHSTCAARVAVAAGAPQPPAAATGAQQPLQLPLLP